MKASDLAKGQEENIKDCIEEYQKQYSPALAVSLSVLLESEEDGLIKRNWRSRIKVDEMISFIKSATDKVEEEWAREYRQLKRITDYGGGMEYEEMILILSLRSDLESGLRFVSEKKLEILETLDEDLRAVLELNRNYTRDSRNSARRHTGGLETYLTKHWWWRYDEEN